MNAPAPIEEVEIALAEPASVIQDKTVRLARRQAFRGIELGLGETTAVL